MRENYIIKEFCILCKNIYMKILLVTGAIYAQNSSRKHFTGLDYVVTQIGQSLSNDNEIVFLQLHQ